MSDQGQSSRSESEAKKPDRHWLWAFNDWYSKVGAVPVQLSDAFLAGMTAARSEQRTLTPVAWAVVDKKTRHILKLYMTYGDASWGVAECRGSGEMVPLYGEQSTIPAERPK